LGDTIAFEFQYPDGPFFNTFAQDAKARTWTWMMESIAEDETRKLFAVDTLRREWQERTGSIACRSTPRKRSRRVLAE